MLGRSWISACAALGALVVSSTGQAQVQVQASPGIPQGDATYRLDVDALGQARTSQGVFILDADTDPYRWMRLEAQVWGGATEFQTEADLLVGKVVIHDPQNRAEISGGRMIVGPGAVRPIHLDGVHALARTPWATTIEGFGGLSVVPRFGESQGDLAFGGRVGQSIGTFTTFGVSYVQRYDRNDLSDQEVGADFRLDPIEQVSFSSRAAYDFINPGFSEAIANLAYQPVNQLRLELYGLYRAPHRILPSTSLFSVLGDVPSTIGSLRARWRAAPRLDVIGDFGARYFEDQFGERLRLRSVLRLDPQGNGALSGEITRFGGPDQIGWWGARTTLRYFLTKNWLLGSELEIVRPDRPSPRGEWWPWALGAITWLPVPELEVALAAEVSASTENEVAFDGLLRVAGRFGNP